MYIPNIPSVTTSVIDRSTIDIILNGNRTVLLPGFFKYGKEGFQKHSSSDEMKYNLGRQDLRKYGNAYLYGLGTVKTDNILTYRLLPGDATYANNVMFLDGTDVKFESYASIYSKADMEWFATVDPGGPDELIAKVNEEMVLSALATSRGEGYNSIFVSFSPAIDYEKMDSNADGETNYKFNFVQAEVYEETPTGIKSLGDPVVFSLIEYDKVTNEPITDKFNGKNLFVNTVFKDANEFATINVNDKFSVEMASNASIDAITDTRFIVEDTVETGKYYEIKVETYDAIVVDSNGLNHRVPTQRLTTVITNTAPDALFSPTIHLDDTVNSFGKEIQVTNSVISFVDTLYDAAGATELPIDGEEAFYNLTLDNSVDSLVAEVVFEEIVTLRHSIYAKLMDYSMKLYSGEDGMNLHLNDKLNMFGTSEIGKENASELLIDFYNNNDELREILYPKYDFDYIPDWTNTATVQQAIIGLADDLGLSMPILSLPLSYNPTITTKNLVDKDLQTRKETVFQSSYNSAMYSGQQNKTHRTDSSLRMYMPMSYYALLAHLRIDNQYSITEPVANMIKGTLDSTELNLTYSPSSIDIEQLRNQQINSVIVEPDGTYIIDQLTMYKKASKLSRINVVKPLHRIRKDLPRLLKDLLQTKAIGSVIDKAVTRTENELAKWVITPENTVDGIFKSAIVKATFNEDTYKLRLTITVNPVGTLESIDIPIIVV